jgi:hypothetical protein
MIKGLVSSIRHRLDHIIPFLKTSYGIGIHLEQLDLLLERHPALSSTNPLPLKFENSEKQINGGVDQKVLANKFESPEKRHCVRMKLRRG